MGAPPYTLLLYSITAELTHLTALNLSRNPIHCPPQCVIARGTKVTQFDEGEKKKKLEYLSRPQAILEYLRGLPAAEGHVGNIQPVSNPVLIDGPLYPLSERLTDKVWRLSLCNCNKNAFNFLNND